jgi:hypothetical protein
MKDDREAVKRSIDALKAKLLALVPESGNFPTAIEGLCLYRQERDVRKDCCHDPVIGGDNPGGQAGAGGGPGILFKGRVVYSLRNGFARDKPYFGGFKGKDAGLAQFLT